MVEPDWHAAREIAAGVGTRLRTERIPLARAGGRTLAGDLRALGELPSYTSSAMDGWAVAGPGPWRVEGRVLAGDGTARSLGHGEAIEIATGGMLPAGADGVLRSEDGHVEDSRLRRRDGTSDPRGRHARPSGEEARPGDVLARAGTVLTPPLIGLAAAAGHDAVDVTARPRLATLLFGDELVHDGVAGPGRVRDALGPQLDALLDALGAHHERSTFVPDDLEATVAALAEAPGDVVVTTGSTAHGPRDLLHAALDRCAGRLVIDEVAVRPGHPMLLATLPDGRPLVGLPGNPLSASVGMLTLLDPLLRAMAGRPIATLGSGTAAEDIGPRDLTRIAPVTRGPDGLRVTDWTGSGMLRGLAVADALAVVPVTGIRAGDGVETLALPW